MPHTRTTTFVDCIEDKTALLAWGKRMVLAGAARTPHLLTEAATLDPADRDDKKALDRLANAASAAAGADAKRDRGTQLHAMTETIDLGRPLPRMSDEDVADMAAYMAATVRLDMLDVERLVVVDELRVAGTPDRICRYAGPGPDGRPFRGNVIADLKTGSVEHGALKMAMQLACYAHGQHYDPATGDRTPLPQVNQDWGIIIHLPAGSATCTLYWIDLARGWQAALVAQRVRELRNARNLLTPLTSAPAADDLAVAALDAIV